MSSRSDPLAGLETLWGDVGRLVQDQPLVAIGLALLVVVAARGLFLSRAKLVFWAVVAVILGATNQLQLLPSLIVLLGALYCVVLPLRWLGVGQSNSGSSATRQSSGYVEECQCHTGEFGEYCPVHVGNRIVI